MWICMINGSEFLVSLGSPLFLVISSYFWIYLTLTHCLIEEKLTKAAMYRAVQQAVRPLAVI